MRAEILCRASGHPARRHAQAGGLPTAPLACCLTSGLQVRSMFPLVAEAVEAVQPGAQAAAAKHFAAADWYGTAPPDDGPPEASAGAGAAQAAEALLQAEEELVSSAGSAGAAAAAAAAEAGSAMDDVKLTAGGKLSAAADWEPPSTECSAELPKPPAQQAAAAGGPPAVLRPSAALEAAPQGAMHRLLDRAGLSRLQLVPALHMLVLFAAAGTLTVCRAAFVGLLGKSDWVAFSGAPGAAGQQGLGHTRWELPGSRAWGTHSGSSQPAGAILHCSLRCAACSTTPAEPTLSK